MRTSEKIIAVLSCLICLSACGDKEVTDVSGNIMATEPVTSETTTATSVSVTMSSAENTNSETIPQTTSAETVTEVPFYFDEENEVPENAAYKEIVLRYSKYHGFKVQRYVTFYDIHDNPILKLCQTTPEQPEQTSYSKFKYFYEYNSDGTKSSEEYDTMHGRNHIEYEYSDGLMIRKTNFINDYTQYMEFYEYDEYNNPVKSIYIDYYKNADYEITTTYTYEYDDNGRFTSRITENTDDYQRIEKFIYDENGNIESRTDNDMKINYTYDSNDKLVEMQQYDEDGLLWYELYEYEFYK